eukprot:TRINITY_DN43293_c0_g1_i1.p1 TRINITY_DN43293_c0_g1~~TRINITY_DN43293_c0_g1_i1.p1  ORF type:complete len:127 (+),score=4.99 TRINITY_DN43293_c0_g1_i1:197-577(+)
MCGLPVTWICSGLLLDHDVSMSNTMSSQASPFVFPLISGCELHCRISAEDASALNTDASVCVPHIPGHCHSDLLVMLRSGQASTGALISQRARRLSDSPVKTSVSTFVQSKPSPNGAHTCRLTPSK